MPTPSELIKDAQAYLTKSDELLSQGNWQRAIFDLGCASARILQVVELFIEYSWNNRGT